jgi:hypothetical protein
MSVTGGQLVTRLELERDTEPDAVVRHLAVLDRDVDATDLCHPKIADRPRRRLDRGARSRLWVPKLASCL